MRESKLQMRLLGGPDFLAAYADVLLIWGRLTDKDRDDCRSLSEKWKK